MAKIPNPQLAKEHYSCKKCWRSNLRIEPSDYSDTSHAECWHRKNGINHARRANYSPSTVPASASDFQKPGAHRHCKPLTNCCSNWIPPHDSGSPEYKSNAQTSVVAPDESSNSPFETTRLPTNANLLYEIGFHSLAECWHELGTGRVS